MFIYPFIKKKLGVFLCGSCNLLFGTLEHVEDDTQFTILCLVVRGLGAAGASAFSTAGATYVANLFPDKISVIMVSISTSVALEIQAPKEFLM